MALQVVNNGLVYTTVRMWSHCRNGPGQGGDDFGMRRFPVDPAAQASMEEWLGFFRMKVVDVNRTSRGSPTGGIGRFSALVVVGNSNVSSWAGNAQ